MVPFRGTVKAAFQKLIRPVVLNVKNFEMINTLVERRTIGLALNTGDKEIFQYVTNMIEELHRVSKGEMWDRNGEGPEGETKRSSSSKQRQGCQRKGKRRQRKG